MNVIPSAFGVVIVFICAGCGASKPVAGIVGKEWSENTTQLGIQPIWPPRELVFPGDVYISLGMSSAGSKRLPAYVYTATSQFFDELDLGAVEDAHALKMSKLIMSPMDSYESSSGTLKPWRLPGYESGARRTNGLVGFPGFSFASVSDTQLGANVVTGIWAAIFGGGRKSTYTVSFAVPAAEYRSLPLRPVMAAFKTYNEALPKEDLDNLQQIATSLTSKFVGDLALEAYVVIPNEVYYARVVDITITAENAYGGQLAATTTALIAMTDEKKNLEAKLSELTGAGYVGTAPAAAGPASSNPSPVSPPAIAPAAASGASPPATPEKSTPPPVEVKRLEARIASIQNDIESMSKAVLPNAPGVTGSVSRSSINGVTFSQVFSLPIAIGYKGLSFKVNDVVKRTPRAQSPNTLIPLINKTECKGCDLKVLDMDGFLK